MKLTIKTILFILLVLLSACNRGDTYYLSDIDTYVTIQKTKKGCYISFEKSKVENISATKKDYILVPNISNLFIIYDSISKNDLQILCVEEFNTTNAFLNYNKIYYNFHLYPYSKSNEFFEKFYDSEKKSYKHPYKMIRIGLRDNQVDIDGKVVNEGNNIGKPS